MAVVTKEEILKIANLSKLWVSEEELEALTRDMGEIIEFANTINAVSDSAEEFDGIHRLSNVFRPDEVIPSYPREKILKNVDGGEDGYFSVKKRG